MKFKKGHTSVNKGKKFPHLTGENSNHWKGGKITLTCRHCAKKFYVFPYRKNALFCSISCFAKHSTGTNAKHWKGGITSENHKQRTSQEYNFWRKECLKRDNFTCQKTGISGGTLHIHHINNFKDFPELRFDISNGITLSEEAHRLFHKKYGNTNNTIEQLYEFINS